jgi:LysR family cyn operon transcriptional activator
LSLRFDSSKVKSEGNWSIESGRVVRPTDLGLAYIGFARRALLDLEAGRRALHDVRDLSRGAVRVAFTPTFTGYLVGPLVGRLRALQRAIKVDCRDVAGSH